MNPYTRLWKAVLIKVINDYRSKNLWHKKEAEIFLFQDNSHYPEVCRAAGLDPVSLRTKLQARL